MTEENEQKMFDLGYSTTGGTGYGLYIVKQIVEKNDWSISVEHEEDKEDVAFVINFGDQQ